VSLVAGKLMRAVAEAGRQATAKIYGLQIELIAKVTKCWRLPPAVQNAAMIELRS
jgi:hypothetical protein